MNSGIAELEAAIHQTKSVRRYDVDWLRVLALGLLIVYHVVVSFQPWAVKIFFIQNEEPLEWLWIFMALINIWRIPILFLISGMGVCFAMQRRNWKQLLKDRTIRILIPFVFGFFFICPISAFIAMKNFGYPVSYVPNTGHLWFLANIFLYVLLLLPLLSFLNKRPANRLFDAVKKIIGVRAGLLLFAVPVMLEAMLINPQHFSSYALSEHGFWLGMVCFITGFIFVSLGSNFWRVVERDRKIILLLAVSLYVIRLFAFELEGPHLSTALESMCWMIAALGFGSAYLNKPSDKLVYFSTAVYPIYIVHMPVQYAVSFILFPLALPASVKLLLLLFGTFGGSLMLYEVAIKHLKWIRPLFGLKIS